MDKKEQMSNFVNKNRMDILVIMLELLHNIINVSENMMNVSLFNLALKNLIFIKIKKFRKNDLSYTIIAIK